MSHRTSRTGCPLSRCASTHTDGCVRTHRETLTDTRAQAYITTCRHTDVYKPHRSGLSCRVSAAPGPPGTSEGRVRVKASSETCREPAATSTRLQPGTPSSLSSLRVGPASPLPGTVRPVHRGSTTVFRIILNVEDRRKKTGQRRVHPACRVLASGRTHLRSFSRRNDSSPRLPPPFRSRAPSPQCSHHVLSELTQICC